MLADKKLPEAKREEIRLELAAVGIQICLQLKNFFHRFRYTKNFSVNMQIFSYPSILTYVMGAQKNRLIETVLLSTHNICFG